jgi:hypothetical protein
MMRLLETQHQDEGGQPFHPSREDSPRGFNPAARPTVGSELEKTTTTTASPQSSGAVTPCYIFAKRQEGQASQLASSSAATTCWIFPAAG